MYWPPTFTPNSLVTITDDLYVAATGGPARFASYVQPATVISPWLARTDQDGAWMSGDPMLRVLLAGDPLSPLPTFNDSGFGAVIALGAPVVGVQAFEVVSRFDWIAGTPPALGGRFAWGRLWGGFVPPPSGLSVAFSFGASNYPTPGNLISDSGFAFPTCLLVMFAVSGIGGCGFPDVDGVPMTPLATYSGDGSWGEISVFYMPYAATGVPHIVSLPSSAGEDEDLAFALIGILNANVIDSPATGYNFNVTVPASPIIVGAGNTTVADTLSLYFGVSDSLLVGAWDGPVVTSVGPMGYGVGGMFMLGWLLNSGILTPSSIDSIDAPVNWLTSTVSVKA